MSERYEQSTPERRLSDGLDFYKLTMGQVALERFADRTVTFTLKNRAGERPLAQYVSPQLLNERLEAIRTNGFSPEEVAYFAGLQASDGTARFDEQYLTFLEGVKLPRVAVSVNETTNDFDLSATGQWAAVSLWETVVMSELNELYYKQYIQAEQLDEAALWQEGDKRLDQKIAILKDRPDIKFADFGTRRRFSAAWQAHVLERLAREVPDSIVGTSNPWFAYTYGMRPIGTYAHEMPMVYAGVEDGDGGEPIDGHTRMMNDWYDRYGEDLSIALTDTFTSEFFFADFSDEQARQWRGLRHDSGDPFEFGEKAIEFYESRGIDPLSKTLVFSDGLDMDMIVRLADTFGGRVNILFGWGTSLMNDLGLKANNFVMKATSVDGISTVKLSDDEGKHTGPVQQVERYIRITEARLHMEHTLAEIS